jgi:hypothetical protein
MDMIAKAKMAFAALLVLGSASAALAESGNRINRHGTVVRDNASTTMPRGRNTTVNPPVKPFTDEERAWFNRASRVF